LTVETAVSEYTERKKELTERFLSEGGANFSDCELLELILLIGKSGKEVAELTFNIFDKFRSIDKVLNAPIAELLQIKNLSENTATLLKIIAACGKRAAAENIHSAQTSVLEHWEKFEEYCRQNMAHSEVEEFRVFLLDDKWHCFKDEIMSRGTVNHTTAYPREIVRFALQNKAKGIILAHNHPSGDCKPSNDDVVLTEKICEVANYAEIKVLDHLIVTEGPIFSFKSAGLIKD